MGKTARKLRSDKRKALKRQAKAAKKQLYASYAGTGKRAKKRITKTGPSAQRGNHAMACCGNVGCEKCFPQYRILPQGSSLRSEPISYN